MSGGAEDYAVELVFNAGAAVADAIKYGAAFPVLLHVDERSPFAKRLREQNLMVRWEIRPRLSLRDPIQVASFLRAIGEDPLLAPKIDMNLFLISKRVAAYGRSTGGHVDAVPYDNLALDQQRLVSELGLRDGDELDLKLDVIAVQEKKTGMVSTSRPAAPRDGPNRPPRDSGRRFTSETPHAIGGSERSNGSFPSRVGGSSARDGAPLPTRSAGGMAAILQRAQLESAASKAAATAAPANSEQPRGYGQTTSSDAAALYIQSILQRARSQTAVTAQSKQAAGGSNGRSHDATNTLQRNDDVSDTSSVSLPHQTPLQLMLRRANEQSAQASRAQRAKHAEKTTTRQANSSRSMQSDGSQQSRSTSEQLSSDGADGGIRAMLRLAKQQSNARRPSGASNPHAADRDASATAADETESTDTTVESADDSDLPRIVQIMNAARRARKEMIAEFEAGAQLQNDFPEFDDAGNPVVLLPNIDEYLLALDNEDMEVELHEISAQLQEAVTAQLQGASTPLTAQAEALGQKWHQGGSGTSNTMPQYRNVNDAIQAHATVDHCIALACRRTVMRRAHQQRAAHGRDDAMCRSVERRTGSNSRSVSTTQPTATIEDLSNPSNSKSAMYELPSACGRISVTRLGEQLERSYLPSVLDIM